MTVLMAQEIKFGKSCSQRDCLITHSDLLSTGQRTPASSQAGTDDRKHGWDWKLTNSFQYLVPFKLQICMFLGWLLYLPSSDSGCDYLMLDKKAFYAQKQLSSQTVKMTPFNILHNKDNTWCRSKHRSKPLIKALCVRIKVILQVEEKDQTYLKRN